MTTGACLVIAPLMAIVIFSGRAAGHYMLWAVHASPMHIHIVHVSVYAMYRVPDLLPVYFS